MPGPRWEAELDSVLAAWRASGAASEAEMEATADALALAVKEGLPQAQLPPLAALRACFAVQELVRLALHAARRDLGRAFPIGPYRT